MSLLPSEEAAVSPVVTAGLLLAAIPLLEALEFEHPTVAAVIAATGVSRSRAYEVRTAIETVAPTVVRSPGRPSKPVPEADHARLYELASTFRDFAYAHPGAVGGSDARRRYSDDFRRFVLDLAPKYRDVTLDALADAIGVPLPTLKDWLAGGIKATKPPENLATVPSSDPTEPQIETLLAVWKTWSGSFCEFCKHVQNDWRIPFGRTLIAEILDSYGVRFAKRRSGRSPDEDALRGQFETFFPNAQWVGDGSQLNVTIDSKSFPFNVELMIDPCSGAVTGASVRDTEDSTAVIEAFEDGVATTGVVPQTVLLDNKPSNHADAVVDALGDTEIVRATPYRPQNKAHVEGGFGLFKQVAPALSLAIAMNSPREIAQQFLEAIVVMWARTLNHRPRRDRDGRSRVELNLDHSPTQEEIEHAKNAFTDRIRKQEKARETCAARQNPLVRATIIHALARFQFDDPDGKMLDGIARYPLDAVVEGIAIVDGKRHANTLPDGVDARYLLGCVRNVAQEREGFEIALALWDERARARDAALDAVEHDLDKVNELVDDLERRVAMCVDRALATTRRLDRFFWLNAITDAVLDEPVTAHRPLFRLAARRIHTTHAAPHRERLAATRFLASRILPIS